MAEQRVWVNLGWLFALVAVFAVPLTLDAAGRLNYFWSLTMWALPVAYLLPVFLDVTEPGRGNRRRALLWTIGSIVALGVVLDFLLGHSILVFEGCAEDPSPYLACLPAIGSRIPVEEIFFYALGPAAIVLVYACTDERWIKKYNPPDERLNERLVQPSPKLIATAVVAAVVLIVVWRARGTFPAYAAFLTVAALLPAMFLYRCVHTLVNWPAFAITTLYVIVTSLVWEATLAIPRGWWGYNPTGLLGIDIGAWSHPNRPFPVEAAFVWLCAPFSSIFSYEFTKALMQHRATTTRVALFGPPREASRTAAATP